jgi:hypothetical protein
MPDRLDHTARPDDSVMIRPARAHHPRGIADGGDGRLVIVAELSLEAACVMRVVDGAGPEDASIVDQDAELAEVLDNDRDKPENLACDRLVCLQCHRRTSCRVPHSSSAIRIVKAFSAAFEVS